MKQTSLDLEGGGDPADAALRFAAAAPAGHFDELRTPDGQLRPHWRGFFEHLGAAGLADLDRRLALLRRRVHEHGVTYNVYGDEHGPARRWLLDLLPFIVARDEWKAIEEGVVQRAGLLSALMQDIYGEQRLLRDGLLPPSLVLGNPNYLRPVHGFSAPGGVYLHLIAFDLARAPDGHWWVASQRTQAPSGLGYALENRLIVSRLFADGFAGLRVQRLASSFRRL
ncbi:MAG TPA: circularly permuted type 2 ATP-grasp protein, partial [Burkholderiaceae bacterium]